VAEPLPELLHWTTATPGVYTTRILDSVNLDRLVGAIVLQHLLELEWFCNNLVTGGGDQYGDTYTYTITAASGSKITIAWISTYGDARLLSRVQVA
jgi:hypothetical protein